MKSAAVNRLILRWVARLTTGIAAAGIIMFVPPAEAAVCTVGNGSLAFGTLAGLASTTTLNGSGSFTVTCTAAAPYTISLDKGTFGSSISSRLMQLSGGGATISYQVYQDAMHITVFGDGTIGSTKSGSGTGIAQTTQVFGQIPSQNVSMVGAYSDSITITVTF